MTQNPDNSILRITRLLVYLIMGFVALAGIALVAMSVALPFFWTEAVAEIVKNKPEAQTANLMPWLMVIFALLVMTIGLVWTMMRKLLAIIGSVENADPFVAANAIRLRAIGWLMVGVQIIGIPLATTAGHVADMFGDNDVGHDFPINGILAILLVFILAGIFERGAEMREELEGTV
jgi:magnesium-transporting ATPase (P-type)